MSPTNGDAGQPEGAAAIQGQARLGIGTQYVKDLSFENPGAPQSLSGPAAPQVEVNVEVNARGASESVYEVSLRINASAKRNDQTLFLIELDYAGMFTLQNVPRDHVEAICLIECPRLLFPFARRIIADATRDGGFPPLLLEPIDFVELYRRSKQQPAAKTVADRPAP